MHRRFAEKKYASHCGRKKLFSIALISNVFLFAGGKKPVEHHAAVWVPDNEANVCMHCKRTQFTMLVRRVSKAFHWTPTIVTLFYFLFCSASLPKLWSCSVWSMFIEKVLIAATEYKAITRLLGLLWFAKPIEERTGKNMRMKFIRKNRIQW